MMAVEKVDGCARESQDDVLIIEENPERGVRGPG